MASPLGLRNNLPQFLLLVLVNAFVGGMVGLERSILPRLAETEFGVVASGSILTFLVAFGLAKAVANLYTGRLVEQHGRKRLLVAGWLLGVPVPLLLLWAPSWGWVVAANVLLGVHQGFAWSTTVLMKIDLVGARHRGLAMGLNEFAGYLAVAATSLASAWIADAYGVRPYPFYLGLAVALAGLLLSLGWVRDTTGHVFTAVTQSPLPRLRQVFLDTSWRHRNLGSVTLTGLVNNLNDGVVWGILPLVLTQRGFGLRDIGSLAAIYPAVWGLGQALAGPLADRLCKKQLLLTGMLLQGLALIGVALSTTWAALAGWLVLLGVGTALVYPTLLAAVAENTHPLDRARSLSVFRFWRDLGYAVGAVLAGGLVGQWGNTVGLLTVGGLTAVSGVLAWWRMRCSPKHHAGVPDFSHSRLGSKTPHNPSHLCTVKPHLKTQQATFQTQQ